MARAAVEPCSAKTVVRDGGTRLLTPAKPMARLADTRTTARSPTEAPEIRDLTYGPEHYGVML